MLSNWGDEKTLDSPLDSKEIKSVNPKGNQLWIFIGKTDTEAPIPWSPDAKSPLTGKDPDAGKDWGQEEKGATEDEMVGWHLTQWTRISANFGRIVEDRGAWHVAVHGVTKSWTGLSEWTSPPYWTMSCQIQAMPILCSVKVQYFWQHSYLIYSHYIHLKWEQFLKVTAGLNLLIA